MEEEQGIDADENFVEKVESFRVDIVQTIDLERQLIFSYLRANSVLDVEDCETIMNSGSGRKQRVAKFLDVLACKGPDGYKHFVSALEIDCPQLFKKITGKNARKSQLVLDPLQRLALGGGLADKEWVDFERQYLSNQLENTTSDLQKLTHFHNKVVHEKNLLEKKFMEAQLELESQQQQIDDMREQLEMKNAMPLPSNTKAIGTSQAVQRYIQELMAENADKSNRIISLQESLLHAVGSAEKERISNIELQQRHENIRTQMRDLTINYDWERRNSRKMTEKMRKQTDQIKQGEDLRREIFELNLRLTEMQDERDEAREELREFRNVTEALNAKFDSVCEEKEQAIEFREIFSSTVFELRENEGILQTKLQEAYLELNDLKRKNMRLTQECKTVKQQRDAVLHEREMMIVERNSAVRERDEALRLKKEMQQSRDEAIEAQLRINQALHDDCCKLHEEMDAICEDLRMISAENERQRLQLREYENANQMTPTKAEQSTEENSEAKDATQDDVDGWRGSEERLTRSSASVSQNPYPWRKERSSTAILNSAYRRLQEDERNDFYRHRGSMPAVLDPYRVVEDCVEITSLRDAKAMKQGLKAKTKTKYANEQKGKSQSLTLNITAAKALSKSLNSLTEVPKKQENDVSIVKQILPAITDFSMSVAMKTGSLENVVLTDNGKSSPPFDYLRSPDPKRTHPPLKSVSPKILYKVDPQASSAFDFSVRIKDKESSTTDARKGENANSETSNGVGQDTCGRQGKKAKNGKSTNKQRLLSDKSGKSFEISSIFQKTLSVRSNHRRRHSSGDVTELTRRRSSSSDE